MCVVLFEFSGEAVVLLQVLLGLVDVGPLEVALGERGVCFHFLLLAVLLK